MASLMRVWALPTALLAIINVSATWYNLVSEHVPEPYLVGSIHTNEMNSCQTNEIQGRILSCKSSQTVLQQ